MRSILLTIVIILTTAFYSHAQYFQFSQYNFTPQRINPAIVAQTGDASASFLYRNQSTDGGFHLNSTSVNASYPIIARSGRRWSGVGISFMDDRSGQAGIYNTQEAALTYAVYVPLTRLSGLSLGIKTLYQTKTINLDGLYTGAQYIPDRGFSNDLSNGEPGSNLRSNYISFSTGLYWQETDRKGNTTAYAGISFFDFNKPQDTFLGSSYGLSTTFTAMAGVRVYQHENISILPEILITRSAAQNTVNAGFVTSYNLSASPRAPQTRIDILTKYIIGRSGIVGLQLHKDRFSIGFSYDFPASTTNVYNTGAFELGLAWKKHITPGRYTARNKTKGKPGQKPRPATTAGNTAIRKRPGTQTRKDTLSIPGDTLANHATSHTKKDLSTILRNKQDSVKASASAGALQHEPLVLEKATLHFNFQFNSVDLDPEASRYFDELAEVLHENPEIKINLTGHTDNIGSDKFNIKLSLSRAMAIKDYLITKGISADRITAEGRGMREPKYDNTTDEGRAQNRRVELTILYSNP